MPNSPELRPKVVKLMIPPLEESPFALIGGPEERARLPLLRRTRDLHEDVGGALDELYTLRLAILNQIGDAAGADAERATWRAFRALEQRLKRCHWEAEDICDVIEPCKHEAEKESA